MTDNDVGVGAVPDGPNKVFLGGLPYHWRDEEVRGLLGSFGALKSFHLVSDAGAATNKGFAFCEYQDPVVGRRACEALNGQVLGSRVLCVRMGMDGAHVPLTDPPSLSSGKGAAARRTPAAVAPAAGLLTQGLSAEVLGALTAGQSPEVQRVMMIGVQAALSLVHSVSGPQRLAGRYSAQTFSFTGTNGRLSPDRTRKCRTEPFHACPSSSITRACHLRSDHSRHCCQR
jgi:hypothetical protein